MVMLFSTMTISDTSSKKISQKKPRALNWTGIHQPVRTEGNIVILVLVELFVVAGSGVIAIVIAASVVAVAVDGEIIIVSVVLVVVCFKVVRGTAAVVSDAVA